MSNGAAAGNNKTGFTGTPRNARAAVGPKRTSVADRESGSYPKLRQKTTSKERAARQRKSRKGPCIRAEATRLRTFTTSTVAAASKTTRRRGFVPRTASRTLPNMGRPLPSKAMATPVDDSWGSREAAAHAASMTLTRRGVALIRASWRAARCSAKRGDAAGNAPRGAVGARVLAGVSRPGAQKFKRGWLG